MLSSRNSGRFISSKYWDKRNKLLQNKDNTTHDELIEYDLQKDLSRFIKEENYIMEFDIPSGFEGDTKKIKIDIRDLPRHS